MHNGHQARPYWRNQPHPGLNGYAPAGHQAPNIQHISHAQRMLAGNVQDIDVAKKKQEMAMKREAGLLKVKKSFPQNELDDLISSNNDSFAPPVKNTELDDPRTKEVLGNFTSNSLDVMNHRNVGVEYQPPTPAPVQPIDDDEDGMDMSSAASRNRMGYEPNRPGRPPAMVKAPPNNTRLPSDMEGPLPVSRPKSVIQQTGHHSLNHNRRPPLPQNNWNGPSAASSVPSAPGSMAPPMSLSSHHPRGGPGMPPVQSRPFANNGPTASKPPTAPQNPIFYSTSGHVDLHAPTPQSMKLNRQNASNLQPLKMEKKIEDGDVNKILAEFLEAGQGFNVMPLTAIVTPRVENSEDRGVQQHTARYQGFPFAGALSSASQATPNLAKFSSLSENRSPPPSRPPSQPMNRPPSQASLGPQPSARPYTSAQTSSQPPVTKPINQPISKVPRLSESDSDKEMTFTTSSHASNSQPLRPEGHMASAKPPVPASTEDSSNSGSDSDSDGSDSDASSEAKEEEEEGRGRRRPDEENESEDDKNSVQDFSLDKFIVKEEKNSPAVTNSSSVHSMPMDPSPLYLTSTSSPATRGTGPSPSGAHANVSGAGPGGSTGKTNVYSAGLDIEAAARGESCLTQLLKPLDSEGEEVDGYMPQIIGPIDSDDPSSPLVAPTKPAGLANAGSSGAAAVKIPKMAKPSAVAPSADRRKSPRINSETNSMVDLIPPMSSSSSEDECDSPPAAKTGGGRKSGVTATAAVPRGRALAGPPKYNKGKKRAANVRDEAEADHSHVEEDDDDSFKSMQKKVGGRGRRKVPASILQTASAKQRKGVAAVAKRHQLSEDSDSNDEDDTPPPSASSRRKSRMTPSTHGSDRRRSSSGSSGARGANSASSRRSHHDHHVKPYQGVGGVRASPKAASVRSQSSSSSVRKGAVSSGGRRNSPGDNTPRTKGQSASANWKNLSGSSDQSSPERGAKADSDSGSDASSKRRSQHRHRGPNTTSGSRSNHSNRSDSVGGGGTSAANTHSSSSNQKGLALRGIFGFTATKAAGKGKNGSGGKGGKGGKGKGGINVIVREDRKNETYSTDSDTDKHLAADTSLNSSQRTVDPRDSSGGRKPATSRPGSQPRQSRSRHSMSPFAPSPSQRSSPIDEVAAADGEKASRRRRAAMSNTNSIVSQPLALSPMSQSSDMEAETTVVKEPKLTKAKVKNGTSPLQSDSSSMQRQQRGVTVAAERCPKFDRSPRNAVDDKRPVGLSSDSSDDDAGSVVGRGRIKQPQPQHRKRRKNIHKSGRDSSLASDGEETGPIQVKKSESGSEQLFGIDSTRMKVGKLSTPTPKEMPTVNLSADGRPSLVASIPLSRIPRDTLDFIYKSRAQYRSVGGGQLARGGVNGPTSLSYGRGDKKGRELWVTNPGGTAASQHLDQPSKRRKVWSQDSETSSSRLTANADPNGKADNVDGNWVRGQSEFGDWQSSTSEQGRYHYNGGPNSHRSATHCDSINTSGSAADKSCGSSGYSPQQGRKRRGDDLSPNSTISESSGKRQRAMGQLDLAENGVIEDDDEVGNGCLGGSDNSSSAGSAAARRAGAAGSAVSAELMPPPQTNKVCYPYLDSSNSSQSQHHQLADEQQQQESEEEDLAEALRLKHEADTEDCIDIKRTKYLQAFMMFSLSSHRSEKNGDKQQAFNLFDQTLSSIKFVMRPFRKPALIPKENTDARMIVLYLRSQSLLNLKLYKLKKHELKEYQHIISTTLTQSASQPDHKEDEPGSQDQPHISPTPSPAGSEGSNCSKSSGYTSSGEGRLAQQTPPSAPQVYVSIPKNVVQNQFDLASYLSQCHELWEQADLYVSKCKTEAFFNRLDKECGPLTLHSSIKELVNYTRKGLEYISQEAAASTARANAEHQMSTSSRRAT